MIVENDRLLAKRLLQGDEGAFRDMFDSYFPRLYRYALARLNGNQDEARDIVQQTFCNAFARLDSYRGEASLYGWMCRICTNCLIDRARRHRTELQLVLSDADDAVRAIVEAIRAPESEQPEHEAVRMRLLELIQTTLDCLPEHYGNVLEWKYVDGLTVDQIATQLAIAPKAAESLLGRARSAFKAAIVSVSESGDLLPADITATAKG